MTNRSLGRQPLSLMWHRSAELRHRVAIGLLIGAVLLLTVRVQTLVEAKEQDALRIHALEEENGLLSNGLDMIQREDACRQEMIRYGVAVPRRTR